MENDQINIQDDNNSLFDSDTELEEERIEVNKNKISLMKKIAKNIQEQNERLLDILNSFGVEDEINKISVGQLADDEFTEQMSVEPGDNVIEGVFDGEGMIGPDGKKYSVPSNYASKSKLVEGDIMKLTITDNGTFVYKQIGPIERRRVVGTLEKNAEGNFYVDSEDKKWYVLTASITFFKGGVGDEVVLLVPKNSDSKWGAVENIIKQS